MVERHGKAHGRREYRRLRVSSLQAGYSDWPYLSQAFEVVRSSPVGRHISRDERYGIASAPASVLSARRLMGVVRGHWQIENGLHYRRDVSLREDASQVRMGQAPQVLAGLNNAVCGTLARAGLAIPPPFGARWPRPLATCSSSPHVAPLRSSPGPVKRARMSQTAVERQS